MHVKLKMKYKILALLFISSNAFCLNRSDLRTEARLLARDTGTTRVRYTDTQINNLLAEGESQAISMSECIYKSFSFDLQIGVTYYTMPDDFKFVRRLTRDSLELKEMTPAALDGRSRGWEDAGGVPTYYFTNFSSRGLLGFAPVPAVTGDTSTVKIEYFSDVSTMTADSSVPYESIGELTAFQPMLAYYAAYIMTQLDGKPTIAASYLQVYQGYLKLMTDKCVSRPNYLPSLVGTMK